MPGSFSGNPGFSGGVNLGTVYAEVQLRADALNKGAAQAKQSMKQLEDGMKRSSEQINASIGRTMSEVGKRVAAVFATAAIVNFGREAVNVAAKFERLGKAIKAVDGAASDTNKTLEELARIAEGPGLTLESTQKAYIRLRQAGMQADLTKRAIAEFGNALVAAGRGADDLEGVVGALLRMQTTGQINARSMVMLGREIPQIGKALQDSFGTRNIQQITATGVSVQEFIEKFVTGLSHQARMSGTAAGAFKNLNIAMEELKKPIGDLINSELVPFLNTAVIPGLKTATTWFKGLPEPIKAVALAMGGLAVAVRLVGLALGGLKLPAWLLAGGAAVAGGVGLFAGMQNTLFPGGQRTGFDERSRQESLRNYQLAQDRLNRARGQAGWFRTMQREVPASVAAELATAQRMLDAARRDPFVAQSLAARVGGFQAGGGNRPASVTVTAAGRLAMLQQEMADVTRRLGIANARAATLGAGQSFDKVGAEIARLSAYQQRLQAKIDKLTPKSLDQLRQEAEQAQREAEQKAEQDKREAEQQAAEQKRVNEQKKADTKAALDDIYDLTHNDFDRRRRLAREQYSADLAGGVALQTARTRRNLNLKKIDDDQAEQQKQHQREVLRGFYDWADALMAAGQAAGEAAVEARQKAIDAANEALKASLAPGVAALGKRSTVGETGLEGQIAILNRQKAQASASGANEVLKYQMDEFFGKLQTAPYSMNVRIDAFKENMRKSFDFIPDLFSNLADEAYGAFTGTLNKMFGNNPFGRALARTIDRWMSGMMDQALASVFTRSRPGGGGFGGFGAGGGSGIAEGEPNFTPALGGMVGMALGGPVGMIAGTLLGSLFHFQQGGPVPGPIGYPRLAVVHGGEYVMSRAMLAGAGAGANANIIMNIHAAPGMDVRQLAKQVAFETYKLMPVRPGSR